MTRSVFLAILTVSLVLGFAHESSNAQVAPKAGPTPVQSGSAHVLVFRPIGIGVLSTNPPQNFIFDESLAFYKFETYSEKFGTIFEGPEEFLATSERVTHTPDPDPTARGELELFSFPDPHASPNPFGYCWSFDASNPDFTSYTINRPSPQKPITLIVATDGSLIVKTTKKLC